jgi:hypothetical protein
VLPWVVDLVILYSLFQSHAYIPVVGVDRLKLSQELSSHGEKALQSCGAISPDSIQNTVSTL